jgi:heptaprenylglyceryl phosphate synthase
MKQDLYNKFREDKKQGKKSFSVLIDPDKVNAQSLEQACWALSVDAKVDYFFVGGSLVTSNNVR